MIRVDVKKEELEGFIDSLDKKLFKESYKENKKEIKNINFDDFKSLFCTDDLDFNDDSSNLEIYKLLHKKISSDNNIFYTKIREFIIKKFTESIKFCPYCWKNPFIHFDENNKKKRMFQFDHFFPKNVYHRWIINFYNLIPSCNACNHLKLDENPLDPILNWWVIFHPYFWNLYQDADEILQMDYWKNVDIRLNYISENSKFWKLWKKYLNSQDTFNEFDFIQDKRTKMKAEKLKFKNTSKTDEQFKEYFFKNYSPKTEDEILKYSNGKLKKELIENLKL